MGRKDSEMYIHTGTGVSKNPTVELMSLSIELDIDPPPRGMSQDLVSWVEVPSMKARLADTES